MMNQSLRRIHLFLFIPHPSYFIPLVNFSQYLAADIFGLGFLSAHQAA